MCKILLPKMLPFSHELGLDVPVQDPVSSKDPRSEEGQGYQSWGEQMDLYKRILYRTQNPTFQLESTCRKLMWNIMPAHNETHGSLLSTAPCSVISMCPSGRNGDKPCCGRVPGWALLSSLSATESFLELWVLQHIPAGCSVAQWES